MVYFGSVYFVDIKIKLKLGSDLGDMQTTIKYYLNIL